MALTDQVIMPGADYQAAANQVRALNGTTATLKSGEMVTALEGANDTVASQTTQINALIQQANNLPDAGGSGTDLALGITGATVGQIAKITAVGADGKPTAWTPVDMPSGGASEEYELIFTDTVTENAAGYFRDTDANGNTFALKKAILIVFTPPYEEIDASYGRCVGFVPTVRWGIDNIGSLRDPIKSSAGGTGRYEVIFAEVIMGYQVCTAKFESQNTANAFSVMQGVLSAGTTGLQFVSDATKLMQVYNPTGNMTCVKIAGYASPIIAKNTQIKLYGVRA